MSSMWIILIAAGGVVVLAVLGVFIGWVVRAARQEREAVERARREFAERFGFALGSVPGPFEGEPVLRGVFDGLALEIGEHWRSSGGGRGHRRLTTWRYGSATPWPGGLVAYTPGFRLALGGPSGSVYDSTQPVRGYAVRVNDYEIGDAELDGVLAIDATDLRVARALLLAPEAKGWILHAARTFGHVRIRDREVTIEVERRVRSSAELVEGSRCVTSIARALERARAQPAPAAAR
jgi:hypothetical protein